MWKIGNKTKTHQLELPREETFSIGIRHLINADRALLTYVRR